MASVVARGRASEGLVGARSAGGEEIEAVVPLVSQPGRADAALVPAMADAALLPDPGLILAPELDPPVGVRRADRGEPRPKPIF
jgi:hypothetical protein